VILNWTLPRVPDVRPERANVGILGSILSALAVSGRKPPVPAARYEMQTAFAIVLLGVLWHPVDERSDVRPASGDEHRAPSRYSTVTSPDVILSRRTVAMKTASNYCHPAYNNLLQPCRMDVNSSGAAYGACTDSIPSGNVQDFNYGFSYGSADNGDVTAWTGTGQQVFTRSYGYDSLNRLSTMGDTATAQPCKGLSWTYDAWGNRTAQNVTSGACPNPVTPVNTTNRLQSPPYYYDAAGNMTNDGVHAYAYDAENHLIQVDSGSTATYVYDADGRRVEKTTSIGHTDYLYDTAGNVSGEWQAISGYTGPSVHYAYMNGQFVAEYTAGTTYFIHKDHLGSTRLMTKVDGTVYDSMDYLPFGEQTAGDTGTTHKFTGKERDTESGLDNFGLRYLTSSMGRFMSPDSIANDWELANPQTWNRYAYARNNPLIYVDPDGAAVELICTGGNADQCAAQRQAALQTLQNAVGNKQAADSLYINEVKDGDNTRYFVGIKGDVGDFESLSSGAKDLGEIVGAKQVVEFGLTDKDLPGAGKGQGSYTYAPGEIGNANPRVLVNPSAVASASIFFSNTVFGGTRFGPGEVRDTTTGIAAFHEFGHAWKMWQNINAAQNGVIPGANGIDPRLNTSSEALRWENRMRQQVYGPFGPKNAERKVHD
jgi:RHS repeat-associated protein